MVKKRLVHLYKFESCPNNKKKEYEKVKKKS